MAEINIVRRPPLWPWLATAAALLLIIGLIVWGAREDRLEEAELSEGYTGAVTPEQPRPEGTAGAGSAVDEYLRFAGVTETGEAPQVGREHEYTAEGLRKLAAALESMRAGRRAEVPENAIENIRAAANRIQQDPASAQHANAVREAFLSAADVLDAMDAERGAGLRRIAESFSPSEPLLEQRDKVREFFRESAEVIRHEPNV